MDHSTEAYGYVDICPPTPRKVDAATNVTQTHNPGTW